MKLYLSIFILLISCTTVEAQNVKEFTLTSTNNLVINTSVKVLIYKSDTLKVVVNGGNLSPEIVVITPTDDGITVDANKGKYDSDNAVIEIYTNNINKILVSGAGDVKIVDDFKVPEVTLSTSGSSNISGNIVCNKASLTSTGASNIKLSGSAEKVDAVVSGSSNLRLLEFPTKKMDLTVSGASDATVNVIEELNAVASGASDIYYKSAPTKLNGSVSGVSEILEYKGNNYNYIPQINNDSLNPQNQKKFFVRPRHMFKGGRMRQDLVWMGIDIGVDGLVDLSNGFDLQPQGAYNFMEMNYWRNAHVRVNFLEWRFNLVKNVFNIITGMGIDFQHYGFSQKIKFDEADDYPGQTFTTPVIGMTDTVHSINRSRLAVQYFNIPLLLNLRTKRTEKNRHQFNFTFGVVGGIKIGSSSRIQYTENGNDAREEKFDDFNLETFTATAMVRIKYSVFNIYASYQFTPMFRGQNPNLYPFSIGVTLLSW